MKKVTGLLLFLICITSVLGSIHVSGENLVPKYEKYLAIEELKENEIEFKIVMNNGFKYNDRYLVYAAPDEGSPKTICQGQLSEKGTSVVIKRCEFSLDQGGNYTFNTYIIRDEENERTLVGKAKKRKNIKAIEQEITTKEGKNLTYKYKGNTTEFTIKAEEIGILKVEIPKSILEEANKTTFSSNKSYEIIEKDPLVAWNVDKAPSKVKFNVEGKADKKDMQNMKVRTEKPSSMFIRYLFIILILALLIFIVSQFAFKKGKKSN